jgi:hypothetical protein
MLERVINLGDTTNITDMIARQCTNVFGTIIHVTL